MKADLARSGEGRAGEGAGRRFADRRRPHRHRHQGRSTSSITTSRPATSPWTRLLGDVVKPGQRSPRPISWDGPWGSRSIPKASAGSSRSSRSSPDRPTRGLRNPAKDARSRGVRVLVAFDKVQGFPPRPARPATELAAEALRREQPQWQLDLCPLTDGGEGFAEILTRAAQGEVRSFPVAGPRGGPMTASLGLVRLGRIAAEARKRLALELPDSAPIALVEMAAASGLTLLAPGEGATRGRTRAPSGHRPVRVCAAADWEPGLAVILGVGGSCHPRSDLGLGVPGGALGLSFLTADGQRLEAPVPAAWPRLVRIEGEVMTSLPPIRLACDVANPPPRPAAEPLPPCSPRRKALGGVRL